MDAETSLRDRVSPFLLLTGIFALALFVRTYFAYGLAIDGYLVSGGSDSFYFKWIIANLLATGKHFAWDPMLNFPLGMVNPRPPFFAWSIVLTGILAAPLLGSVEAGVGTSLLFSTAFWGALTIFPTYFLAKEVFGRRTGYVAAFFLAILAAHIQRSVFSNADHDAPALFFVVTGFYFFLRSLATLRERTWVESWIRPRAVARGLQALLGENRNALLLAILAGTAVATVALTWKGYAYAVVILIAYFLVQLLVHQIQNRDPLGVLALYTVTLGTAFLLAFPYYLATNQVGTWFDVPLYLFLAAAGLGLLFAFLHRLPWLLVVPPVVLGFGVGTLVAAAYSPAVAQALGTGLGYFVRTKVFETIAEAQPPNFSQGMLAFGPVTALLSFLGLALMGYEYVKRPRPSFLFALVWMVAAIFMAMSAVRFLFNASPAFAITAAWVTVLLVERLGLEAVRRAVTATGGSKWVALKRGLKLRHVAGALFVVFLLVLPNAWYAVDAGSPFEMKDQLEQEVLRVTPDPLRPPGAGDGLFYFGAFGFSVPLESRYFPAAWDWLRNQDADVNPPWARPAFISWWDYGFEAIQEGRHPAVADNFQNGIPAAGHFLTAQSENEAIAVLSIRLLQGRFDPAVQDTLAGHGLDADLVRDALRNPSRFIPLIRADPDRFGRWDDQLTPPNAQVIFLKTLFTETLDLDGQASLYQALRGATGHSISYVAVDSRLIPFSGTNTGIFFAPVKLSDHPVRELPDGRTIPSQFYSLEAVTPQGTFPLGEEPPGAQVTNIRIQYHDMFYDSMVYRAFFGPRGRALVVAEDGLPGLSGEEMSGVEPRQAWALRHFRLVYKTAYVNPFPPEEVANHSDAWRAVNYFDALELQERIQRGEAQGTVDLSGVGLRQGVVILQYFDGALLRGRVATEEGRALSGVRVTALDEAQIPHDSVLTDARGRYELVLPFGDIRVVASVGTLNNATRTGATVLGEATFTVTEEEAFRVPLDTDQDGRLDYLRTHDFLVPGSTVLGRVFLDRDDDGTQDDDEPGLGGVEVQAVPTRPGPTITGVTRQDGSFELTGLLPGLYALQSIREGFPLRTVSVSLNLGETRTQNVAVRGAVLTGQVQDAFGDAATEARVVLTELATGNQTMATVNATGGYRLPHLLPGNHSLVAETAEGGSLPVRMSLTAGVTRQVDLTVHPLGTLEGQSLVSFSPSPYVTLSLHRREGDVQVSVTTGADARFSTRLPLGTYDAYALHVSGGRVHAFLGTVEVGHGVQSFTFNLRSAHRVDGTVTDPAGAPAGRVPVAFQGDGNHQLVAGRDGRFTAYLPGGDYRVWSAAEAGFFLASLTVDGPRELRVTLEDGVTVTGRVYRDHDGNGTFDPGEGLPGIEVRFRTAEGLSFPVVTTVAGRLVVSLGKGTQYTLSVAHPGYEPLERGPLTAAEVAALEPLPLVAKPVSLSGSLGGPDGVDPAGLPVAFEPLGDGAEGAEAVAGADGAFSVDLLPGRYRVRVDANRTADGSVVVQSTESLEVRVVAGQTPRPLPLDLVERVRVAGFVDVEGEPFEGDVTFRGPETATVAVEGNYSVHLRRGDYTAYAVTGEVADRALLAAVAVPDPRTDVNLSLEEAAAVRGALRVDGSPVDATLELLFQREDGARLTVDAPGGAYEAVLVLGVYEVTATWRGVDRVDGPTRFVRYDLQASLNVTGDAEQDLIVARSLDNATATLSVRLSGNPAASSVTLRAANETAMDRSVQVPSSGEVAVAVAPGVYDLYAFRATGNAVALLRVTVPPDGAALAVALGEGQRVSGLARLEDGTVRSVDLRFTAEATAAFTTDPQGFFEVFLPAGGYQVVAETQRVERTLPVTYRFTGSVDLTESTVLAATLARVDVRGVDVTWDPDQRTLIPPGGEVRYTVTVRNTGNVRDTFELSGDPADWGFAFQPRRVALDFGTENVASVQVRIAAPSDALVAHDPLTVTARSQADPGTLGRMAVAVDILQVHGLDLRRGPEPPALAPTGMEVTVEVVNAGNGPDTYALVLLNPDDLRAQGWSARLVYQGETYPRRVENIVAGAGAAVPVTLQLEPVDPRPSPAQAVLRAASQGDPGTEARLEVPVVFPSLGFQRDGFALEGPDVSFGPPEFPWVLYGLLAASAVGVTVLLLRYGREGRRRR